MLLCAVLAAEGGQDIRGHLSQYSMTKIVMCSDIQTKQPLLILKQRLEPDILFSVSNTYEMRTLQTYDDLPPESAVPTTRGTVFQYGPLHGRLDTLMDKAMFLNQLNVPFDQIMVLSLLKTIYYNERTVNTTIELETMCTQCDGIRDAVREFNKQLCQWIGEQQARQR